MSTSNVVVSESTDIEQVFEINEYRPELEIIQDHSEKSSSGVWRHFGALRCDKFTDTRHVYCINCFKQKKIKKYQRSTSTGNLSKHLKKQHRISLEQTFVVKKDRSSIRVSEATANAVTSSTSAIVSYCEFQKFHYFDAICHIIIIAFHDSR